MGVKTQAEGCERCGAPYVEIQLRAGDGGLTMRSCSECDHRTWQHHGEPVDLDHVLSALGKVG